MTMMMMMMRRAFLTLGSRRLVAATPRSARSFSVIYDSGSVTYSGGQATDGQGGYYGSGGARKKLTDEPHRPELLAMASDVQHVAQIMEEVNNLEELLEKEKDLNKSMEARGTIKKLMTSPELMEPLERLECVKGEPKWGLSLEERELIQEARMKVNAC